MAKIVDLRPGRQPARANRDQVSLFAAKTAKRPMPLRARRRRVRALQLFVVLLVLAAGAWGLHLLSYLPVITIQTINVTGAHDASPDLVKTFVQSRLNDGTYPYLSRSNIFLYPRASLQRDVAGFFPRIRAATVSRPSFLSTELDVAVQEREPFARWCEADGVTCYEMDSGGFIFADASSTAASVYKEQYVFSGGIGTSSLPVGQYFVAGNLPALLALLTIVQQQTALTPQLVTVESPQDFSVQFAEGFSLKASFGADASTLARNLKLVLSSAELAGKQAELEYIDLRFGNRVFYKLKGQDQQVPSSQ